MDIYVRWVRMVCRAVSQSGAKVVKLTYCAASYGTMYSDRMLQAEQQQARQLK